MKRLARVEQTMIHVPVISVGNITVGGTGKTPVCRYFTGRFEKNNKRVGIVTRGYGRRDDAPVVICSGDDVSDWMKYGDEPTLFLRGTENLVVAIDIDRGRSGLLLADQYECDVLLADDAFQFVTLHRDVDIVVLDSAAPFGFDRLLPRGLLREPVSCLERADVFWIAKADTMDPDVRARTISVLGEKFHDKPIVESALVPVKLRRVNDPEETAEPGDLRDRFVMCVSGIGVPESFEKTVRRLTKREIIPYRFTDHHAFTEAELRAVEAESAREGVEFIVTTEKDAVRIPRDFSSEYEWWVLESGIEVLHGHETVERIVSMVR